MIGREGELRLVESFIDGAGRGTHGLVLQGEAGIGKTTLWQAALDAAGARGYRILVTRTTQAEARLPFAALNDLFGDLADSDLLGLPPPQRMALDVALMRAGVGDEPMQPLALSLAVLEVLRSASARQPLAIGLDDVQWLDESSAGLLRFAVRRLEREPVVVIATERTEAATSQPPDVLADLAADRIVPVRVDPLTIDDIDRLLDDSLDLRLSPTVLRRVHGLAGGNPFYAIEIGRGIVSGGLDPATDDIPLPDSLAGLVRARLASLSPDARAVTIHAAALAKPTALLLEAALGAEHSRAGVAEARLAGVLGPGDDPVRFTHPLLAAEAYGAQDESNRRELHRRLASVVSEPEELARHLALAASGSDPEVADALDGAAEHAHGRGAPDAAAELSELAARLTPASEPGRAHRMAAAGRFRLMAGDVARARALLEGALAEPSAKRGPARAQLLYRLAGVRQLMDDFDASRELGLEALRHAADDAALTVQVKLLLAGVSYVTGHEWEAGARHAFEAWELAERLDDPPVQAATIGAYISWRYATGHGIEPDLARRAAELEPWTRHFRTLDLPEFDIAGVESSEGATRLAFARMGRLLDRAERDGDYSSLPFLLGIMTMGDFIEGRSDLARDRIERGKRLAETTAQRTAQVHLVVCEARLEARLGNVDAALRAAREAFDLMDATKWRLGEAWLRGDLALLELSRGDAARALEHVAPALQDVDRSGRDRWARAVAVEALVALGRHDQAGALLDTFEEAPASSGSPWLRAEALRGRARLLAAVGEVEAAGTAAAEAEAVHRRGEDPFDVARTLLVVGEIHRRARRRARARAALREALETFTLLGARLWAARAREQLARIGSVRAEGGLTPTQREVADLVAIGLTNRQVADRLSMSPHTVDAHLKAIYRALEITSRTALPSALEAEARDSSARTRDRAPS